MSIADEIERLQGAKNTLKTKINSKNDGQHQITNETIDEYGDFVDSISGGGGDTILDVGNDNASVSGTTLVFGEENLPYTELEYITATGSQYLADISTEQDFKLDMNLMPNKISSFHNVFEATNLSDVMMWINSNNKVQFGSYSDNSYDFTTDSIVNIVYDNTGEQILGYLNGTQVYSRSKATGNPNIKFFHRNQAQCFSGRIYSIKIYVGTTLIKNLIPVIRKSDNVVCLYDTLTQIFLTNVGTGSFGMGPVKGGN